MVTITIQQAQADLPNYLKQAALGERVVVVDNGVPLAEIGPTTPVPAVPRVMGMDKGKLEVPASFFEPLPDDLLKLFEGGDEP